MVASKLTWIKDKLAPAPADAVLLRVSPEHEVLQPSADAVAAPVLPGSGWMQRVVAALELPWADAAAETRVGGDAVPGWAASPGAYRAGVDLVRVFDVHHAPGFGAVINDSGTAFQAPVREATFYTPTLAGLPGARGRRGRPTLWAPWSQAPHLAAASIFMPWGSLTNYGHFLLDALPGLVLLADRDLLPRWPALAPPLASWQRELLDLALAPGEEVAEIADPLVRVDDLLFTTCMDHFLHAPNAPFDRVRERVLQSLPQEASSAGARIYLSRRGQGKRMLVNEAELETELRRRGFAVIAPESLPIADQITLFRDAEVVVSPTGAALANVLFMRPGAQVIEIQPSNFVGIWVRAVCLLIGVHWFGYFRQSPLEEQPIAIEGALQPGLSFSWDLPLGPFLDFLDARL